MIWFIGDAEAHYDGGGSLDHIYSHLSLGTPVARVDRTSNTATAVEYQFHGLASSTLAAVANDGTINASFSYTPWGAIVEAGGTTSGTTSHRRRHNDKYVDEVSNLAYYGARYYDKTLIGWTQSDPLYRFAPDAGWTSPRRACLYTFSSNNALRYIDPDGRDREGILPAIGAGIGLVGEGAVTAFVATVAPVAAVFGVVAGVAYIAATTDNSVNQGEAIYGESSGRELGERHADESAQNAEFEQSSDNISKGIEGNLRKEEGSSFATAKDPAPPERLGTMGGDRAGKPMTQAGKKLVKEDNKARNNGKMKCEGAGCGKTVKDSKKSKKGVSTPKDAAQVDHIYPKSKGGDGSPCNGQVLCAPCNNCKSDKQ